MTAEDVIALLRRWADQLEARDSPPWSFDRLRASTLRLTADRVEARVRSDRQARGS